MVSAANALPKRSSYPNKKYMPLTMITVPKTNAIDTAYFGTLESVGGCYAVPQRVDILHN